MEFIEALHMNGGKDETSYANNSSLQRHIIALSNSILEEAVTKCLSKKTLGSIGIVDLGCSSGPNTLVVVSKIINTIQARYSQMGIAMPELRVSLNDLPGNDFNHIFATSLPVFYTRMKREKGIEGCFLSCVAGSFYGRLFPQNSLHLVHSSSSLHWLSQVPRGLDKDSVTDNRHLNKGKLYISKTSPACVAKAYLYQFQDDFYSFLKSRAEEVASGGHMVLSFMGRVSPDPSAQVGSHQWELLAQALMIMASRGLVDEENIDAFNAPYYAPSAEELREAIQTEDSFVIDQLEECEVGWDEGFDDGDGKLSRGQWFGKVIRAVVEPMMESTFGGDIMDELFQIYGQLVDDYFSNTTPKYINTVVSLARKTRTSCF